MNAIAEGLFFSVIETTLNEIVDCSEKQFIQLSASEYDPNACILFIDYTEENYSIVAVDGETAMLVYPFVRDELSDCIVELLFHFDALEEQLPDGRYLQYDLKLAEEETYHITKENLYDFVPSRRIIHQNMRHRAYRLPVLND